MRVNILFNILSNNDVFELFGRLVDFVNNYKVCDGNVLFFEFS